NLEGHRLRPLAVIASQVHIHDAPAEPLGRLSAQPIYVVVSAADPDQVRSVHRGGDDFGGLKIVGYENPGRQSGPSSLSGHRVGQISGGGTPQSVEAQ